MDGHGVSRRRFTQALGATLGASLVGHGVTDAVAGGGPAGRPLDARAAPGGAVPAARRSGGYPAGAARLDSNENPYGPCAGALAAMDRSQKSAARYPDAAEDDVRQAIARQHGVAPENVLLGCGSGEILRVADMAFLAPDRTVVAAEPTFEAVLLYARVTRAEAIKVPLTPDFRHDLPRMAAACDGRTGLVYVCNPNNPTGTIVTREELGMFFERVPKSARILVDEAYHHFVEDAAYASASEWLGRVPNLILVRTFSKIHGLAGMRLGYAVAAKESIDAMREHALWSNTNAAVLEAALASLLDEGHVPRTRRTMNDTRRWLCAEIAKDGRPVIPSETNFVMIDVGDDVAPVIAALRGQGVFVGRKFPSMPRWLRVSIGAPEEMRKFLAAFRAVVPERAPRAARRVVVAASHAA